jgi:hypothetical protein
MRSIILLAASAIAIPFIISFVAPLVVSARPYRRDFSNDQAAFLPNLKRRLSPSVRTRCGVTHQIGALAAMLPAEHAFRPDLAAFDRFSSFATATRYPRPGGGLPREPSREFLAEGIRDVTSLVDEIDDYRREKSVSSRPR